MARRSDAAEEKVTSGAAASAPVDERVRRWTRLIIRTVLEELNDIRLQSQLDVNSPDRDILTPQGCQTYLQIGEKALLQLRKMSPPIPYIEISNSYRYPREAVLRWVVQRAESTDLNG